MSSSKLSLQELQAAIQTMTAERAWQVFHTPKNLACSVSVEAAELLELFLWLTPEESSALPAETLEKVRDEIGDVLICLLNLADRLGIDPLQAATTKLESIKAKYPIELAKGHAKKYDQL